MTKKELQKKILLAWEEHSKTAPAISKLGSEREKLVAERMKLNFIAIDLENDLEKGYYEKNIDKCDICHKSFNSSISSGYNKNTMERMDVCEDCRFTKPFTYDYKHWIKNKNKKTIKIVKRVDDADFFKIG